ncbi:MAG: GTPase HflX, partial [Butyrivibrio sp.]|nr:GTPase HflX [Butyrivibrio sp.]
IAMHESDAVVLVGLRLRSENGERFDRSMEELSELVRAAGMSARMTCTQTLDQPVAATLIGSGKIDEIRASLGLMEIRAVVFNNTLSPKQHKNLTEALGVEVIDRTGLILLIFADRARTREARLQVEAAQLAYLLPRLAGLHEGLTRQGGTSGPLSGKGAGEKQIELDRRRIEKRLSALRRELKAVERERATQRSRRMNNDVPRVSLVGYTNAGKSTIMNALLQHSGAAPQKQVLEKDMLFATLDTTVRRICLGPGHQEFLLSDTVGFVDRLPAALVDAFHSTLEEACYADLLLIVIDVSDPSWTEQVATTLETIAQIGAGEIPRLFVFNKADRMPERPSHIACEGLSPEDPQIVINARDKAETLRLAQTIEELCT